ncbi:MAG: hypothetical protein IKS18_00505 [Lachnospiraceae bacterium]|nr:hypothetical protein [Lachnospiraceae bacterium]
MNRKKEAGRRVPGMTKVLAVVIVMAMVMMMSKNAFAASTYTTWTILGHDCYASLGIGQVYGTGETTCAASGSECTVTVTLVYYYYSEKLQQVVQGSSTQYGRGYGSAYANAFGGSNDAADYASSTHTVTFANVGPMTKYLYIHI